MARLVAKEWSEKIEDRGKPAPAPDPKPKTKPKPKKA